MTGPLILLFVSLRLWSRDARARDTSRPFLWFQMHSVRLVSRSLRIACEWRRVYLLVKSDFFYFRSFLLDVVRKLIIHSSGEARQRANLSKLNFCTLLALSRAGKSSSIYSLKGTAFTEPSSSTILKFQ